MRVIYWAGKVPDVFNLQTCPRLYSMKTENDCNSVDWLHQGCVWPGCRLITSGMCLARYSLHRLIIAEYDTFYTFIFLREGYKLTYAMVINLQVYVFTLSVCQHWKWKMQILLKKTWRVKTVSKKTCKIVHVIPTLNLVWSADYSTAIDTLASNNCLFHRNLFQNGVNTF